MAYLSQKSTSPFWFARWRDANGRQHSVSTRVRVTPDPVKDGHKETARAARARAQQIADTLEAAGHAQGAVKRLQGTIAALHPAGHPVESVRAYLARYLGTRAGVVSPATLRNEKHAASLFLAHLGTRADEPLDSVTRADVLSFVNEQLTRVRTGTVGQYISRLCTPFAQAFDAELISRNPFAKLMLPRKARKDKLNRQPFTPEEVSVLIERLPEEWASMVQCSLWLGGLRLGDTAMLRWKDIDFDAGIVTLRTRKTSEDMRIPLIPRLLLHLAARERTGAYVHPNMAAKFRSRGNSSALSEEFAAYVRAYGIGEKQAGDGEKNGYTSKTFHCLRATAATLLHLAGVDQTIAMKILSHNSEAIHQVYVRPSDEQVARALGRLEDI